MKKTQEQLDKLREVAETSLNKTEELQKVLAQIEAQTQNERMKAYYLKNKEDILQKRKNSQKLGFPSVQSSLPKFPNWLARVK